MLDTPIRHCQTGRMQFGGAYTADRTAALSGVPRSTVHYWARSGYLVPSRIGRARQALVICGPDGAAHDLLAASAKEWL